MTQEKIEGNNECDCTEFEFVVEPDETGALITHTKCKKMEFVSIEDLQEFKRQFPETKVSEEVVNEKSEYEVWQELLKELPSICMYAPIHEPQRETYIMNRLKDKYSIALNKQLV